MAWLKKRKKKYYASFSAAGRRKTVSLHTENLQVAKQKLANLNVSLADGGDNPLPTRTPIADVLTKYVQHIRTVKTAKSAQTDVYYLREAFGPICPALQITSRKVSAKTRKRPIKEDVDRRIKIHAIMNPYFESITTSDVADFIGAKVRSRGLAPKTANRYREILCRLFNWTMGQGHVRIPGDKNPAQKVERYMEKAPRIRFLTLEQIDEQIAALADCPRIQTMVAMYIYAGLRREEALRLTMDDVDLDAGANGMLRIQAKTVNGDYWQPKTRVNRAVPISKTLREYLERYAPGASDGGWYFPSPQGKFRDPDNFSKALAEVNKAHALGWTCLHFRHTFGSQLAMKGESLFKISALMGNSPEICRRHYAALIPEAMADTVEFGQPAHKGQTSAPNDGRLRIVQVTPTQRLRLVGS